MKLGDVIRAGTTITSGRLKSPVRIEPEILKVGDPYTVTTRPTEGDIAAFAGAKNLPTKIVERLVKMILSVNGKIAKSGTLADGPLTYEGRATSEGKVSASTILEWIGADTLQTDLADYGTNVMKTTADARGRVPAGMAKALEQYAKAHYFSTATNPDR